MCKRTYIVCNDTQNEKKIHTFKELTVWGLGWTDWFHQNKEKETVCKGSYKLRYQIILNFLLLVTLQSFIMQTYALVFRYCTCFVAKELANKLFGYLLPLFPRYLLSSYFDCMNTHHTDVLVNCVQHFVLQEQQLDTTISDHLCGYHSVGQYLGTINAIIIKFNHLLQKIFNTVEK